MCHDEKEYSFKKTVGYFASVNAQVLQYHKNQNERIVYNTKCNPKQVKSEMVRPLQYSLMLGRAALDKVSNCSCASVVKGESHKCVPAVAVTSRQFSRRKYRVQELDDNELAVDALVDKNALEV